jgi:hypothetical protein
VLTSILNLGAILKFHAWEHWIYCSTIKSLQNQKKKKIGRKYNQKKN